MNRIELHASDISRDLVMEVRIDGLRAFAWRLRAVRALLWLVALVAPFRVEVDL